MSHDRLKHVRSVFASVVLFLTLSGHVHSAVRELDTGGCLSLKYLLHRDTSRWVKDNGAQQVKASSRESLTAVARREGVLKGPVYVMRCGV